MTFEPPYPDRGGSSGGASGGAAGGDRLPSGIAPVRAFVVLVIFVVAAVALVSIGTRPTVSGGTAAPPSTTPTTAAPKTGAPTTTTTTTTTVPHSAVSVLVANATETNLLAAHYSSILTAQGWAVKTPVDAATTVATSSVYYATGEQEPAASIATALGIKPAEVLPLTAAVPVTGASGTDVVVVIGADLVPPQAAS
jgi:hypothetical protein